MKISAELKPLPFSKGPITKLMRIMKLTAILIFSFLMQVSATGTSQKITLSEKNVPIQEVFREIQKQTDFNFLYTYELVDKIGKVSIEVRNVTLQQAMKKLLKGTSLGYTIIEKTVLIKVENEKTPAYANLALPTPIDISGIIDVSGIVTDENGKPLEGVSVLVKGSAKGTSTNATGEYRLENVDEDAILVFSRVGYSSKEIQVKNRTNINVTLDLSVTQQEEIVVSTGYQTIPKERVTGSFTTVREEELDRTVSYSIVDKLEGVLSGLLMDQQGITIRGVSTLNASRLPLIVLDGFPITIDKDANDYADENEFAALQRALESINPSDVKSVTVLKDAAAASIWGVRATNGVIVITTKRTRSLEPVIHFSSSFSATPKPDVDKLPYANPETTLELEKGRYEAGWFDAFTNRMDKYYYNMSDYAYTAAMVEQGLLPASDLEALEQQMRTYDNRYDFSRLFMQPGTNQRYNLSIAQNAGFNNYRFSVAYDRNNSVMKQNNESRIVLNLTNQFKPTSWLAINIGSNLSLRKENRNGLAISDLFGILPHQPFIDENGNYASQTTFETGLWYGRPFREKFYAENPWLPYDWGFNLKREFDNKDNTINTMDLRLQGGLTIKPFGDMVTLDFKYQYERGTVRTDNMFNEESWETRSTVNIFASPDGNHPVPKGSIFDQQYNTFHAHDFLLTGSFYKNFGSRHTVALLAGAEVRDEMRDASNSRRYGYDPQTLNWAKQMDYATRYPKNMYPSFPYYIESAYSTIYNYWLRQDRYISTFGNAAYTLDNKYDITGSWRLDKSNMFGESPQYRQVPLWSVGGGWTISKESFFNTDFINRLRLRVTYGKSGNVDKSTSPYAIAAVGGGQTNHELQLPGAEYTNPANPELRWEKTKQFNAAIEFSLLDNRIEGEIEYYNKVGTDLLATKAINSTYGFNRAAINFGGIKNTGVDVVLSATVLKSPFTWRTRLMQSFNRNRVTKSDIEDISQIAFFYLLSPNSNNRLQAGKPRYYLLSIPWGGLSEDGIPQFYQNGVLHNSVTTDLKSNTPSFGFENLIYEGPTQASYYGSWNNIVSYKQWELSVLAIYKFGHVYLHTSPFRVSNNSLYGFAQGNLVPHYSNEFENMWREPGDEDHTNIPRLPLEYTGTSARSKTAWYSNVVNFGSHQVMNAATIRLQRVTVSYALNKEWLPKNVRDIRILLQGRNLHTFTFNKYNEDPEHLPDMYGSFLLATSPEYTISIQASF